MAVNLTYKPKSNAGPDSASSRENSRRPPGKPPLVIENAPKMYKIGDFIVYGSESVCRVDNIGLINMPGIDGNRLYYTLSALYRDETVFTPVDTSIFMRPVITCQEAKALIQRIPQIEEEISCSQDVKFQAEYYQALMQSHDCADMVRIIAAVITKRKTAGESGSKMSDTDSRYKRLAEDLLDEEFAVALGIPKDEVRAYVEGILKTLG